MVENTSFADPLWQKCERAFNMLHSEAVDGVWEGYLSNRLAECGIAGPTYNKVMFYLSELGAVEKIRRGSRFSLSKWRIHKDAITREEFDMLYQINTQMKSPQTKNETHIAGLRDRIASLEQRLGVIEGLLIKRGQTEGTHATAE